MEFLKQLEVWFVVGSQHLYGPETLKQVADHAPNHYQSAERKSRPTAENCAETNWHYAG